MEHLPDEICLIIFKKINDISLLYSLMGINQRIDKILHDSTFTKTLSFMKDMSMDRICLFDNQIIDRFCLEILPRIEHKVEWINIEMSSMKRILLSANYPNLYGLGIYNIDKADIFLDLSGKILICSKISQLNNRFRSKFISGSF